MKTKHKQRRRSLEKAKTIRANTTKYCVPINPILFQNYLDSKQFVPSPLPIWWF